MTNFPSAGWIEMAVDVVSAVRSHWTTEDYKRFAKISEPFPGRGYLDRMKVLDLLITEGVIRIDGHQMRIGEFNDVEWIKDGLISGSENVWKFLEIAEPVGNFSHKFEYERLAEIGKIGEEAVITLLRAALPVSQHERIIQVSLTNDGAGFDILAPSQIDNTNDLLLEVKTTIRPGPTFDFFLTRNEYRVGMQNPNWKLVFVRITDSVPMVLGTLKKIGFGSWIPIDQDKRAKWQSVKISIENEDLSESLG